MAELSLVKAESGALVSMDPFTLEYLKKLKTGFVVHGKFTKVRNPAFHRKGFALLNFAFEMWDAPELEYEGVVAQKDFDSFRKNLTIMAGFYDATAGINGEVQLVAHSLKFGSMDDLEFEKVYKALLDTIWNRILLSKGYNSSLEVDRAIDEYAQRLLGFAK